MPNVIKVSSWHTPLGHVLEVNVKWIEWNDVSFSIKSNIK